MDIARIEAVGLWIVLPLCIAIVASVWMIVYGSKDDDE
jgi:hypothetical protein